MTMKDKTIYEVVSNGGNTVETRRTSKRAAEQYVRLLKDIARKSCSILEQNL